MFFDGPPEAAFDRLTRLVTLTLDAPVSLLSLVDGERSVHKSVHGLGEAERAGPASRVDDVLCRVVVASGTRLLVDDVRADRRVADGLGRTGPDIVAYAGVPVHAPGGRVVASLAAIDIAPRVWSARDVEVLESIALSVESEFALRDRLTVSEAARRQADALAETRRAIIDMCNHELRNPLNVIVGGVSLLRRPVEGVFQERAISLIEEAGETMLALIEKTLIADPMGAGPPAEAADLDDVRAMLAAKVDAAALKISAAGKPVTLALQIAPEFPTTLPLGKRRFALIFDDLLDNAVRYTEAGRITVRAERDDAGIAIRIVDTGRGIAPDDQDRVFCRYTRIGSGSAAGFGLGLHIARETARALGGDVVIEESVPDRGSTFTIRLPESGPEPELARARPAKSG